MSIEHTRVAEARPSPRLSMWRGWLPLVILPVAVAVFARPILPPWAFMWTLALAIYAGCKWLTWRRSVIRDASIYRQAGYLLAWPGLDTAQFLSRQIVPANPKQNEWYFAGFKMVIGLLLLFGAARFVPTDNSYQRGWVGMIGIVLTLHFGVFHLLSCAWRQAGVDARPLMNWPLLSVSLSEFWGKRWNTAFRDLTHRYLFRPLTARLGIPLAVMAGFTFSGLIHDAVISYPASGGYGGPTLFFVIQGFGLLLQKSRIARRLGLAAGFSGWLFTTVLLLAPVPLLFHKPFVDQIILPFMHAIGATS